MHTATMPNCTLLGGQFNIWQIVKFSIAPCQIYNFTLSNHHFHISTFTLQTWQVYIILLAAQKFRLPQQNPLIAQMFFYVFFAQTLFFWAVLFWGGWGACISGLPSYLLAYILTYLGYLSTYLPTYLGVDPYSHLPTI